MTSHSVPIRTYVAVFAALMALTLATTGAAFVDLGGALNSVVALTIAVGKALLVILFFMHARTGSRLTWVFIGAGFLWLLIMITLTLSDPLTRNWIGSIAP